MRKTNRKNLRTSALLGVLVTGIGLISGCMHQENIPGGWTKTFGGSADDCGYSVQQTEDGGYIITGWTESYGAGGWDLWLIKTDASGNKEWSKNFGNSGDDWGESVKQTKDGGYIVTGGFSPEPGTWDVWLIKTDASGNKEWSKTFGGTGLERGHSVQQTKDGGYIIVGKTESYGAGGIDVWLIKTDSLGNKEWGKTFGGEGNDECYSVWQTNDGGYIFTGQTNSYGAGGDDIWLIKTDASGNTEWTKTFGGEGDEGSYSVRQTNDGGYIIAGRTNSYGAGGDDVWLIKTDASGNKEWSKTFGGEGNDRGYSVRQTEDEGYIIVGRTDSYGAGGKDVWLIKVDSLGNTEWSKTFGGSADDWGYSIQQAEDGGYIITGVTSSYGAGGWDIWLIKTDASGNVEKTKSLSAGF